MAHFSSSKQRNRNKVKSSKVINLTDKTPILNKGLVLEAIRKQRNT